MNLLMKTMDDILVIGFGEEMNLDSSNTGQLREGVVKHIGGKNKLVINLANITFLDSSGVGTLIAIWRNATKDGGDLRLTGIRPSVRTVFEIVRLHRVFEMYATEEEAIASFQTT